MNIRIENNVNLAALGEAWEGLARDVPAFAFVSIGPASAWEELIVLGGGIGSNPALLDPVRAAVAKLVPLTARIELSRLGDQAALQGAIAVALRDAHAQLFTRAAR